MTLIHRSTSQYCVVEQFHYCSGGRRRLQTPPFFAGRTIIPTALLPTHASVAIIRPILPLASPKQPTLPLTSPAAFARRPLSTRPDSRSIDDCNRARPLARTTVSNRSRVVLPWTLKIPMKRARALSFHQSKLSRRSEDWGGAGEKGSWVACWREMGVACYKAGGWVGRLGRGCGIMRLRGARLHW